MKKLLVKSKPLTLVSTALVIAAVGFAAYILWREGSSVPWQSFHFNYGLVFLSLAISTIGFLPAFFGWRMILRLYDIQNSWRDDLQNYIYAMLGAILPGGVWQIVGRSVLYKKQEINSLRIAAASALEVIVIALAGFILYLVGQMIRPELSFVKWPGFSYLALILVLVLLEPHVMSKVNNWVMQKSRFTAPAVMLQPTLQNTLVLFFVETLMVAIGGTAVFTLLRSIYNIEIYHLVNIVAAYGFSVAFANLFFWLPGRMVLKDGAMGLTLAQIVPAGMAVIFVVIIRLWSIFTVLVPAGMLWLFIRLVRYFRQHILMKA